MGHKIKIPASVKASGDSSFSIKVPLIPIEVSRSLMFPVCSSGEAANIRTASDQTGITQSVP